MKYISLRTYSKSPKKEKICLFAVFVIDSLFYQSHGNVESLEKDFLLLLACTVAHSISQSKECVMTNHLILLPS